MSDVDTLLEHDRDVWAVACNYHEGTSIASKGARAMLIIGSGAGMGYERVELIVRSRGGRLVRKWEDVRRLTNFRAACIPPGHPMRSGKWKWAGLFLPGKMEAEHKARAYATCGRREETDRPKRDDTSGGKPRKERG